MAIQLITAGTYDRCDSGHTVYRHPMPDGARTPRTLVVIDTRFFEVWEGDLVDPEHDIDTLIDPSPAAVVAVLRDLGLTFAAHGNGDSAGDPDGSRTVNYGTGEMSEVSAHLTGFTPLQLDVIARYVDNTALDSGAL